MRSTTSSLRVSNPQLNSVVPVSAVHAVVLDWHRTAEGQGVLAHLIDPETGARKVYGTLERPILPPTVQVVRYKVYLSGRSGIGKTALVAFLSGRPEWTSVTSVSPGETPGIRVTNVYWPTKIQTQLVLFNLCLWDAGDTAGKKYGHIQPVCQEGAVGALFVFSFTNKSSLEEVDAALSRLSHASTASGDVCPLVVGTRYGAVSESEVTNADVVRFEAKWNRPVLRVRHQPPSEGPAATNPNETAFVLNLICDQLWCHHHTQQQQRAPPRIDPALI